MAQVDVTLSKGFWIGKFEVTQGQWKRVVGEFPGQFTAGVGDDFPRRSEFRLPRSQFVGRIVMDLPRSRPRQPPMNQFLQLANCRE